MLTQAQVAKAITENNADPITMALLPEFCDVFGLPSASAFDEPCVRLIADYQRSTGLAADGWCGKNTRAKLMAQMFLVGEPCDSLWGDGSPEHYAALAEALGLELVGAPCVLALRGCYPNARSTHRMIHAPRYDDTAVLWLGTHGAPPRLIRMATHAYQLTSSESPGGAVGSIRPGRYRLVPLHSSPPMFQVRLALRNGVAQAQDDLIPAYRDFDHDGVISEAEAERSVTANSGPQVLVSKGCVANAVLWHPGYDAMKPGAGRPFSSIACQTSELADVAAMHDAGEIRYLLVNAAEAARAMADTIPPPSEGVA